LKEKKMSKRFNHAMVLVAAALITAVCGCSSQSSSTSQATSAPKAASNSATAPVGPTTPKVVNGGKVTLPEMCADFETTAGSNLAKVQDYCKNAPTWLQNGNADGNQCVVVLQNAAELAKNDRYSQQQAWDACNAYNTSDPVGSAATVPGGTTTPLNPDFTSIRP
jgi:hypothetical protein